MASSADITFALWDSNHWDIQYKGTGKISVSRAAGAAKATVTGSASIMSYGGDQVGWKLHMKVGNNAEVTADFQKTYHGASMNPDTGRYESAYDTTSVSQSVSVGDTSGSLDVQLWVTVEDGYGTTSSVQSATVTYDSRGSAVIDSCADMTIGSKVSIGWTAYSTGLYYKFKFTCGNFTAWSGVMNVSTTGAQTYTGYTVPASIAAYLGSASTSGKVNVTLSTYTKDSSGNCSWIGSSSKEVTVYTTKAVAPTMQRSWTLVESNTGNPFKDTGKTTGADGTYRFVSDVTKFKLTVYAYSKYGSPLVTLSGYLGSSSSNSFSASFTSTGSKTSDGYTIYKAEAYIKAKTSGNVTLNFRAYDARGYCCPVVSNGIFTATAATSQADGDRAYVKVAISAYILPQIKELTLSTSGTTVTIAATTLTTDVISTAAASINSFTAKLTRKKMSTGASTTVDVTSKLGFGLKSNITLYSETLSDVATESYEYTLVLSDKYTSDTESKSTGVVALSFYKGGKGAAFFGEASSTGLTINDTVYVANADTKVIGIKTLMDDGSPYSDKRPRSAIRLYDINDTSYSLEMGAVSPNASNTELAWYVWDHKNSRTLFLVAKDSAVIPAWGSIGSATAPVYFNGSGYPVSCGNIVDNITVIKNWKSTGSSSRPIYIDTNGKAAACSKLTDRIIQWEFAFKIGLVGSSGDHKADSVTISGMQTGWKAIGVIGWYMQVASGESGTYSSENAFRIFPAELNVSADYTKINYNITNEGASNWYVRAVVRLLCIYAP